MHESLAHEELLKLENQVKNFGAATTEPRRLRSRQASRWLCGHLQLIMRCARGERASWLGRDKMPRKVQGFENPLGDHRAHTPTVFRAVGSWSAAVGGQLMGNERPRKSSSETIVDAQESADPMWRRAAPRVHRQGTRARKSTGLLVAAINEAEEPQRLASRSSSFTSVQRPRHSG